MYHVPLTMYHLRLCSLRSFAPAAGYSTTECTEALRLGTEVHGVLQAVVRANATSMKPL